MALDELQWGRILALAWLEDGFRKKFETDPVDAFAYLKGNEAAFRSKYGDYFMEELGLEGDNVVLLNLETIPWDGVDFLGLSGERLDEFIQGVNIANIKPPQSPWFWGTQSNGALGPAEKTAKEERTLTAEEWVRVYARIWMDHRLDEPDMDQQYKTKYGPKKGYMEGFEKDLAATVKKIVEEFDNKGWKPIEYAYRTTRLYAVMKSKSSLPDWGLDEPTVTDLVRTGKVQEQPLVWVVNKC